MNIKWVLIYISIFDLLLKQSVLVENFVISEFQFRSSSIGQMVMKVDSSQSFSQNMDQMAPLQIILDTVQKVIPSSFGMGIIKLEHMTLIP